MVHRFIKILVLHFSLAIAIISNCAAQDPTQYVNPFTGTQDMGHTFPGATVPFGMVQLSPDTDTIPFYENGEYNKEVYRYCAGYQYNDSTIVGFSHTHFNGTGHSDLGDFLVMPITGKVHLNPGTSSEPEKGYRSRFSHESETAQPGYYSVYLADYDVKAEHTATARVGIHQYTYPPNENRKIVLDLFHGIYNYDDKVIWSTLQLINDTLVVGYRQTQGWARDRKVFFAMAFSEKIQAYGFVNEKPEKYRGFWSNLNQDESLPAASGKKLKAWFQFKPSLKMPTINGNDLNSQREPIPEILPPLKIKVALSAVSQEGALKNLQHEAPHWDFEKYRADAKNLWSAELSKITIEAGEKIMKNFYTGLYHAFMHPVIYQDIDGKYRGIDQGIHQANGFTNYTIFSLWDTFRALHPLFTIVQPDRTSDMINSMLAHQEQSPYNLLPIWSHYSNENWCMTGYHATAVIADALVKNIIGIDTAKALHAMKRTAWSPHYGQNKIYRIRGYVPFDDGAYSVTKTLEYSYNDWAILQVAKMTENNKLKHALRLRAENYRNVFDPETNLMRPKMHDKTWRSPFDPLSTHGQGFIEGNAYTYTCFVPHDIQGLSHLLGGIQNLSDLLDTLFTLPLPYENYSQSEDIESVGVIGNYVHGNEPGHHIPYLYNYTGEPWKSQAKIRQIMQKMYHPTPEGLCGNDDCGQMSAWYIFSAMGFYPVTPGTDQYVLGSPNIQKATIHLRDNKKFTIEVKNQSQENIYVQRVLYNDKEWHQSFITHEMLTQGGQIIFEMGNKINSKRGATPSGRPYSLSNEH